MYGTQNPTILLETVTFFKQSQSQIKFIYPKGGDEQEGFLLKPPPYLVKQKR